MVDEIRAATLQLATPRTLAWFFLKLGTTAFGGPAAHISLMEDELVTRRHWLTRERFLDLLGAANVIPGPSSTELAIYIGYELGGLTGLMLAGFCFILPAFLIVLAIAYAYDAYGSLPAVSGILYGVKPVLIPILAQAAWRLGKSAIKNIPLALIGIMALATSFAGVVPIVVLFACGALGLAIYVVRKRGQLAVFIAPLWSLAEIPFWDMGELTLMSVFLVFLKVGSIIFGSGYVLLSFLREDLVLSRHWLTEAKLLDSIAVGQVTPGPVFTTATFIGYLLAGFPGAVVATLGIFLPAFVLVALTAPIVNRLRKDPFAGAFLDGLNVASVALIAVVTWQLAFAAFGLDQKQFIISHTVLAVSIACSAGVLLFWKKVNSTWLVLGGGLAGLLAMIVIR